MTFEPIEHDRDDYGPDDAPARPSAGRTGAFWRRSWRTRTGQRDIAAQLRAERDAAVAECARVTRRAEFLDATTDGLRQQAIEAVKARNAAQRAADDDVRAVKALLAACGDEVGAVDDSVAQAMEAVETRFADRIAALEARNAKAGEQR